MAFGDNAGDTYTETEKVSYGSRISSSFRVMLPGILMFLGAFPLLFVTVALENGIVYTNDAVWSAAHASDATFSLNRVTTDGTKTLQPTE